ncbi:MAG: LysM peptidoglycan-binding domain-containing protein [Elusimicrobia bacterium]|nr:LysM peptidoglycan-binding domain-containing protein [Elusimicrobiota bacterium]
MRLDAAVAAFAGATLLAWVPTVFAAPDEAGSRVVFQDIVVRPGQTLGDIANTYLKDPTRWDEILKHNKMPTSDTFVALPGMTIRVPVKLIKENLRAAKLIYRLNEVLFRKKETAAWRSAKDNMELFRDDWVRTGKESKARVKFLNEDLLVLPADSMAVIQPVGKDFAVELKAGGVFVGNSKVVTASARITPKTKSTKYSAQVSDDFITRVKVYEGLAAVEAEGKTVDVKARQGVEVKLGEAPNVPVPIADLPDFPGRAADFADALTELKGSNIKVAAPAAVPSPPKGKGGLGDLRKDILEVLPVDPVSGCHIQAALDEGFSKPVVDRVYDMDAKIDFAAEGLTPGRFWVRFSLIDLLGSEGKPSSPKLYDWSPRSGFLPAAGPAQAAPPSGANPARLVTLMKPSADETVAFPSYRASGRVRAENLKVTVNGIEARVDESGNFLATVPLRRGPNEIRIVVTDAKGASGAIVRTVTYKP